MSVDLSTLKKTPSGSHPPLITIYGTDGVGKTSLALDAPDVVYLPTEQRFGHLEAANVFQTETNPNAICSSFIDMNNAFEALLTQEHNFKTAVVDSLDHFEPHVWQAVLDKFMKDNGQPAKNIEEYGYGKGYIYTDDAWNHFFTQINRLRNERGMTVILVAHYSMKEEKSAEGESYEQYQIKLHKRAASLVRENSDGVFFAKFKTNIAKVGEGLRSRNIGVGTGERILICQSRPSCVVKSSFDSLPAEIPLNWNELAKHIPFFNKHDNQQSAA